MARSEKTPYATIALLSSLTLFFGLVAAVLFNQSVLPMIEWWLGFLLLLALIVTNAIVQSFTLEDLPVVVALVALLGTAGFVSIAATLVPACVAADTDAAVA